MGVRVRTIDERASRSTRHTVVRFAALGSVLAVVAGCGLRVGSEQVRAATAAATSSGGAGGGGGLGAGTGPSAAGNGASPQTATPGSPQASGAGANNGNNATSGSVAPGNATGPSSNGGPNPTVGAPAPAGGNGGSTDVGVTANSINVGNVSDLGGPVPGLFQGGPYGTQAYFNYINSQGGIYGRQLHLSVRDGQLDCSQTEAQYADLVGKVFSFVGGWSLADNCGAQVLAQHPDIPVLNQALSAQAEALPGTYNVGPYPVGAQLGAFQYYKSKYPDAITNVGTIVGNQASAVQAWKYNRQAMESLGYKITVEDVFNPASTNFTADVQRMKSSGVKMVYIVSVNAPDLAIFSQEAYQQGFKPEVFASAIGYFGDYINQSGGPQAVEGQYVNVVQARFLGEDAATIPEVALFDQWIKSSFPTFPIDQFSATSWANAALFVDAIKRVGPNLTRKALLAALANTHTYNDNNMMAPVDVGSKQPVSCYVILQIHGGKYDRVDDPPNGYRCDASFYHYKG